MFAPHRRGLIAALATLLLHGALALAFSSSSGQFTKYPLAASHWLTGVLPAERLLDFSPFYFYLHVAHQALMPAAWWVIVLLQLLAVSAAAGLLMLLLERFFPVWIAASGVAAFALSRGPTVYAAVLEPEVFLLLFLVAFLHFALASDQRGRWIAGCALALALTVRPSVLPLLVFVPVFYWLGDRTPGWIRATAAVLAPSLVVLLALSLRNGLQAGTFSPLGMNPGFVFFEGNNPLSSGKSSVYPPVVAELKYDLADQPDNPHVAYRLIAERVSGRDLSTAEANRYWRRKALDFIADHPARFAANAATKAYSAFHGYRAHDVGPAQRFDARMGERWIPSFPIALLSALALCGVFLPPRDWRRAVLIHALLASQLALMVVMYVSERQRLAMVPGLVFLACSTVAWLAAATRPRRALLIGATVILTVILALPNHRAREDRHLWSVYEVSDRSWAEAVRLRDERRLRESARAAATSFATAPWLEDFSRPSGLGFAPEGFAAQALSMIGPEADDPSRELDRAQLLLAAGRSEEARTLLTRLVAAGDRFDRGPLHSSEPRYYLARSLAGAARSPESFELLEEALREHPGDPFVLAELAALTGNDEHRQRIVRYFSEIDADFLIGLAKLENGVDGLRELSEATRLLPELWRARIYRAAALGANGRVDDATALYLEATQGRQDPSMLEDRIVPIFALAADASGDPSVWYDYGLVLAQFGRFDEALVAFRTALAREPRAETRSAIAEVERMKGFAAGPD